MSFCALKITCTGIGRAIVVVVSPAGAALVPTQNVDIRDAASTSCGPQTVNLSVGADRYSVVALGLTDASSRVPRTA